MSGEFLIRALLSGLIIAAIAVIGRKAPALAALVASLPLISILGMMWLWRDTGDARLLADHAEATFWYVLPSLPMFLLIPVLLKRGIDFWPALVAGCVLTVALYLGTEWLLSRGGMMKG